MRKMSYDKYSELMEEASELAISQMEKEYGISLEEMSEAETEDCDRFKEEYQDDFNARYDEILEKLIEQSGMSTPFD